MRTMQMTVLILLIARALCQPLWANAMSDSLEAELPHTFGVKRISYLITLSAYYIYDNPDKAFDYAEQAAKETQDQDEPTLYNDALLMMAAAEEFRGNMAHALELYTQAYEQAIEQEDTQHIARSAINLSVIHTSMGTYDSALKYAQEALKIYRRLDDDEGIAKALNNTGNVFLYLKQYDVAIEKYEEALTLKLKSGDDLGVVRTRHNIALIHIQLKEFAEAEKQLLTVVAEFGSLHMIHDAGVAYGNLAEMYLLTDAVDPAYTAAQKSLAHFKSIQNAEAMSYAYRVVADVLNHLDRHDEAITYIRKAMALPQKNTNQQNLMEVYQVAAEIYDAADQHDSAYVYLTRAFALMDSLTSEEMRNTLAEMQVRFGFQTKEMELENLRKQHTLEQNSRNYLIVLLVFLAIFSSITGVGLVRIHRASVSREMAERQQSESETKLRHFMNSITEIFNIYDENLNLVDINVAGLASFANGTTRESVLGKHITEINPDLLQSGRLMHYQQVLKTGVPYYEDAVQLGSDFENIVVQVHAFRFSHYLGLVVTNITKRKQIEEQLRKSEAELQAMFDALDDIIVVFDSDARYVRIAQNNPRHLVRPAHELEGKTVYDFFDAGMSKMFHKTILMCLKTRSKVEIDYRLPMDDGVQAFSATTTPYLEDQVVMVIRNVTERDQMMQQLKAKEKLNRAIVEHSPIGISLRDRFGRLVMYNQSWRNINEITDEQLKDEMKVRSAFYISDRNREYLEDHVKDYENIMKHGGELYLQDLKFKNQHSGEIRYLSQYFYALTDDEGSVENLVILSEDVTKSHIFTMTIEESLREKEVLLKELHHRVKNNMQVILSMVKLQSHSIEDARYRAMFKETEDRVRSMALVHEKLYQSENLEHIDFNDYIKSLLHTMVRSINVHSHPIEVVGDEDSCYLDISRAVPCGLLLNELVSNAFKHAFPDNHVGSVKVSIDAHADEIELVVADDGIGFPRDFDFENAPSLGMQLVHALVGQLHASIDIQVDNGTKIIIRFPA